MDTRRIEDLVVAAAHVHVDERTVGHGLRTEEVVPVPGVAATRLDRRGAAHVADLFLQVRRVGEEVDGQVLLVEQERVELDFVPGGPQQPDVVELGAPEAAGDGELPGDESVFRLPLPPGHVDRGPVVEQTHLTTDLDLLRHLGLQRVVPEVRGHEPGAGGRRGRGEGEEAVEGARLLAGLPPRRAES